MGAQREDGGWALGSLVANLHSASGALTEQGELMLREEGYGERFGGYQGRDAVYRVQLASDGYATGFMFEGGKFVRVDVDTDNLVAPGGLVVGMTAADVLAAFPDAEQQPHKYTDGKYLVVKPADGGEGRLVFEVDEDGRITEWRIGLEPQVHYVEGCS